MLQLMLEEIAGANRKDILLLDFSPVGAISSSPGAIFIVIAGRKKQLHNTILIHPYNHQAW